MKFKWKTHTVTFTVQCTRQHGQTTMEKDWSVWADKLRDVTKLPARQTDRLNRKTKKALAQTTGTVCVCERKYWTHDGVKRGERAETEDEKLM